MSDTPHLGCVGGHTSFTAVVTSIDRFPESRPKTVVYLLMVSEPGFPGMTRTCEIP